MIFASGARFSIPIRADEPDGGYSAEDLRAGGWAPGDYIGTCPTCEEHYWGSKLCRRCRACAVKAVEAYRNRPRWQSGHKDIPTDWPVWAYFFESGSVEDEDVMLLRGVAVEGGEVFETQFD